MARPGADSRTTVIHEVRVSILDALVPAGRPDVQAQIRPGETVHLVMTWDRAARR